MLLPLKIKIKNIFFLKNHFQVFKSGSALLLTMFILSGMLIVAVSGAYVIILGIRAASIQGQSTKAYYAAEAGAEKLLYTVRKNWYEEIYGNIEYGDDVYHGPINLGEGLYTNVYYMTVGSTPVIYTSIGVYKTTKRSIELSF